MLIDREQRGDRHHIRHALHEKHPCDKLNLSQITPVLLQVSPGGAPAFRPPSGSLDYTGFDCGLQPGVTLDRNGEGLISWDQARGREPVMRMSTSLLALCCQPGPEDTLETPTSARIRSSGSRSLRMSPLLTARFTSARIAWCI